MNCAEILFLLALDGERGVIRPEMERTLNYALAGAILMELALQNRIDTDLTCIRHNPQAETSDPFLLRVVDKRPTGDILLDEALKELQHKSGPRPTRAWLVYFAREGRDIRDRVTARLANAKILDITETKILMLKKRRYSITDSSGITTIRSRLRELILDGEIPEPREVALAGLADASGLFDEIFSPEELAQTRPRILSLCKLDLIGQAMAGIIREVKHSISTEAHPG
ncbi:MAG: GPP34 family phosphoprotein [Kiritimatiellae bacterium]|nr:GPP34 family phosphoprotein [Kiritimatiellia bacterium]